MIHAIPLAVKVSNGASYRLGVTWCLLSLIDFRQPFLSISKVAYRSCASLKPSLHDNPKIETINLVSQPNHRIAFIVTYSVVGKASKRARLTVVSY